MPELAESTTRPTVQVVPAERRCMGSGCFWATHQSMPICPVCKRGTRALGVRRPSYWHGQWNERVPVHEQ